MKRFRIQKQSAGAWAFDIANIFTMLLMMLIMAYPFMHVFSVSISDSDHVARGVVGMLPVFPISFDGYEVVFQQEQILRAYVNTIVYTVTGTIAVLLICSIGAYPLSIRTLKGRTFFGLLFSLTMILPSGMIPAFLLIKGLGMLDTIWALIIPPVFNFWFIVLLRTNFASVPDTLRESARMDGANEWTILFRIILPLSKPILATVGLFAAVAQWNSFFAPLLYLIDAAKFPLQILLHKVVLQNYMDSAQLRDLAHYQGISLGPGFLAKVRMATVIVAIGPIILVYPFVQKYFVKGALVGSVKG